MANKLTADEKDCYSRLEPTEEYFTLMARDPDFNLTIRTWAFNRTMQIENGNRPDTKEERQQIKDALETGRKGAQWRDVWLLKKEKEGLVFNHEGYPINGPNAVRMTTVSGQEIKNG